MLFTDFNLSQAASHPFSQERGSLWSCERERELQLFQQSFKKWNKMKKIRNGKDVNFKLNLFYSGLYCMWWHSVDIIIFSCAFSHKWPFRFFLSTWLPIRTATFFTVVVRRMGRRVDHSASHKWFRRLLCQTHTWFEMLFSLFLSLSINRTFGIGDKNETHVQWRL